ncbi:MAG: hypothetical protein JWP88_521 [Flaviaesturariibacter sp.]|nr:hypothetical protein [Flaviaesturariibacter sp.]
MLKRIVYRLFFLLLLSASSGAFGQKQIIRQIGSGNGNPLGNIGGATGAGSSDSLRRRNKNEDSITITFRYLDSTINGKLDSSVSDPARRFPIPYTYHYLGNIGSPAQSILFQPRSRAGWDPGFHQFDVYKWTPETVRFFTTTRPYTELGFVLGSKQQQIIDVMHTQNLKPYWNILLQYRAINSPGTFKNQKTAHNNYLFTSWYQSPAKRYNNFLVLVGNKLQAAENGGLRNTADLDNDSIPDRSAILTNLGKNATNTNGFLATAPIMTGSVHNEFYAVLRQQYDFGRKDSIVTDSTVIPLFYPRLRFEHTLTYGKFKYTFNDYDTDSTIYRNRFGIQLRTGSDSIYQRDTWTELKNDFSIYQFPDAKNLNQYIKVGAEYQHLKGALRDTATYNNLSIHGEYRNRTRNGKWNAVAWGKLWLTGYNAGDYHAYISLQRLLSTKIGSLQAGFENKNSEPAFAYQERSNFYRYQPTTLVKENTTHFFATAINPALKLQLAADYYLVANYLYFTGAFKVEQEKDVFNLLRVSALKTFRLGKRWNWFAELYLQQQAGNASVHVPLFLTRNRVQYDGNFGFKNLTVAFGAELRYHTPYKADSYSPFVGQFTYQDSITLKNRPDLNVFFNFRIRSFKAFFRTENLNTLRFTNGAGFKEQNLAAPGYPYPGLVLRFGIYWSFVN